LAECKPFFRGAAIGQLELFASLGVRADIAQAVIDILKRGAPAPEPRPHLLVFAGHTIDLPGRASPRFPAGSEQQARARIRARLSEFKTRHSTLLALASAAPGADVLFHEVCAELGIPTVLCLPMPAEHVTARAYGTLDAWRNRFQVIAQQAGTNIRVLHDGPSLPRWLKRDESDVWERGNRWLIRSARSWDCTGRTLLTLWDMDENDPSTGGTAALVRMARSEGSFQLDHIDSRELHVA